MIEHTYFTCKSSWGISIKIIAEYDKFDETGNNSNAIRISEGLWLRFAEKSIIENEKFYDGDMPYLAKCLSFVNNQIISNSKYENTVITIHSLQFNVCDFQEEGLIAAIIEWASSAFDFDAPIINVEFDKEANKYLFDFDHISESSDLSGTKYKGAQ